MKLKLFLFVFISYSFSITAAQIDTLIIKSKSMKKEVPNLIITPKTYTTQSEAFPVLYLLHGATDSFTGWLTKVPNIQKLADAYNVIIICPDGGYTSWYFDSPIDPKMQYETYIAKELVKKIDKKYNTISNKKGRAITGLSMGGHGAFYLAFKHQDIWGAAGSMSGGVDIRPFPNNWDISKRIGTYAENKQKWEDNSVINMVYLLNGKDLKIIFECGVDDFFYDANKRLHEKLIERNIPHDYAERPGKHNWNYWSNAIKYQMLYFDTFFSTKK